MQHDIKQAARPRPALAAGIRALAMAAGLLLGAAPGASAESVQVDFETRPLLPPQPDNFAAAGPMQAYSEAGLYSISGGVVLGNPSLLPSFALFGSGSNLYGTSDIGDASLLDTITLVLPGIEGVTFVSGVLFNGQPTAETYLVSYFSGADGNTLLSTQTFTDLASADSTAAAVDFSYSSTLDDPITRVTITSPNANANGWDFMVDTVTIAAVPEPSQATLAGCGVAMLLLMRRKQKRRTPV
jgi:hypothetical protein